MELVRGGECVGVSEYRGVGDTEALRFFLLLIALVIISPQGERIKIKVTGKCQSLIFKVCRL